MPSTLTVNGTAYSQAARKTNSLLITARGWDLDSGYWLEFIEYCAAPVPRFTGPVAVSATDNGGTLRFAGDIVSVDPQLGPFGRTWAYRCLGLEYRANQIPVTATDGSGTIVYDLPAESEDYIQANSGLSIGAITAAVLTSHATALSAVGITTDATTASQLAARTLVPTEAVYYTGERLWQSLQGSFQRWSRNDRLVILPSGLVRVVDVTTGSGHTLNAPGQAGADPIRTPLWRREWTHCATRIQARGKGRIRPVYVSLALNTVQASWTGTDESNFKWTDFTKPGDAYDTGTVTTVLGPTSVRCQSASGSQTAAINFWSGRQAWIYLRKSAGTGLTYQEAAPVTANTAMTAGSTMDVTLGLTLDNSGAAAYDSYTLVGKVAPAGTGRNNVYRLYNIVTPGSWVEQHLVKRFPAPVPFIGLNGLSAQLTTSPCALIVKGGISYPATFRVLPATGQILFDRPVVEALNQQSTLDAGGSYIVKPDDIYVLLAYSRGALTATYPPDSGGPVYAGTAYSVAGLQRTRTADVPNWVYEGNQATMVSFAQMIHAAVSDTLLEATIEYLGYYSALEDPSGGHTLTTVESDAIHGGTVSTTAPVRSYTVRHVYEGGGLNYSTEIRCSTRRDPRTDSAFYSHLSMFGRGGSFGQIPGFAAAVGNPVFSNAFGGLDGGGPANAQDTFGVGAGPGPFGSIGRRRRRRPRLAEGGLSRLRGQSMDEIESQMNADEGLEARQDAARQQRETERARAHDDSFSRHSMARLNARVSGRTKAWQHGRDLDNARMRGRIGKLPPAPASEEELPPAPADDAPQGRDFYQ